MTFLSLDLSVWANLATILGVVIGGAALVYSAIQLRISSRVSQAQFWLDLREMFADKHHEIHLQLRNAMWSNDDAHFPAEEEWAYRRFLYGPNTAREGGESHTALSRFELVHLFRRSHQ